MYVDINVLLRLPAPPSIHLVPSKRRRARTQHVLFGSPIVQRKDASFEAGISFFTSPRPIVQGNMTAAGLRCEQIHAITPRYKLKGTFIA